MQVAAMQQVAATYLLVFLFSLSSRAAPHCFASALHCAWSSDLRSSDLSSPTVPRWGAFGGSEEGLGGLGAPFGRPGPSWSDLGPSWRDLGSKSKTNKKDAKKGFSSSSSGGLGAVLERS